MSCSPKFKTDVDLILQIIDLDIDALVDGAFAFVIRHTYTADLICITDVRAAIGLEIKTHDLHSSNMRDAFREQVDLRAD